MKKFIIFLSLLLFTTNYAYSAECSYKCAEPYDMNGKVRTFFSNITGLNLTRRKITEAVIKKTISKSVKGDKIKVNINSYSSKDLANGIFKSLTMSGSNLDINGVHLSYLELKSLCEFNYIQYDKKGNLTFKEDFPMSFNMKVSSDDINKSMESEKYQKAISSVNRFAFAGIKVTSTQSSIRGNKFYYTIFYSVPFMKDQKVELEADLKVDNGKISLKNTRLTSNSKLIDLNKVDSIMQRINPLDFSVNVFNNKSAKIYVKNVAIKNNIIVSDGVIIIPKD